MEINYLIIIALLLVLLLVSSLWKNRSVTENMETIDQPSQNIVTMPERKQDITKIEPGGSQSLLNDPLFKDVIYYENDIIQFNKDGSIIGELGLSKCFKKCNGVCIEYGITGHAYCYPEAI
jgi:hypothetical protein